MHVHVCVCACVPVCVRVPYRNHGGGNVVLYKHLCHFLPEQENKMPHNITHEVYRRRRVSFAFSPLPLLLLLFLLLLLVSHSLSALM